MPRADPERLEPVAPTAFAATVWSTRRACASSSSMWAVTSGIASAMNEMVGANFSPSLRDTKVRI